MGHDPFADDPQAIDFHRRQQIEDKILRGLHGFHFTNYKSSLFAKEKGLFWVVRADATKGDAAAHATFLIQKVLDQCSNDWRILETKGTTAFWTKVVNTVDPTATIRANLELCRLTTVVLKARQHYITRQKKLIPFFDINCDVKHSLDAAAQRLLDLVKSLKRPNLFSLDGDNPILTPKEEDQIRQDARALGPVKQMSSKKFVLGEKAPHALMPIGDFGQQSPGNLMAFRELMFNKDERMTSKDVKARSPEKPTGTPARTAPLTPPKRTGRGNSSTLGAAATPAKSPSSVPRNKTRSEERPRGGTTISGGIRKRPASSSRIDAASARPGTNAGSPAKKKRRNSRSTLDKLKDKWF